MAAPEADKDGPAAPGTTTRGRRGSPLVVLGCRPMWSPDRALRGALGRRVRTAWDGLNERTGWFVVTGGRTWEGVVEADAMAEDLLRLGVPMTDVVRERCSLTTRDNARLTAEILLRLDARRVTLVTCEWHMARAADLFRREGLLVDPLPARAPTAPALLRWARGGHERVSAWLSMARGPRG